MQIDKRPINRQAPSRSLLRYDQEPSEFEIQALLYSELRRMGYLVRGEVPTYAHKARFDIVFFAIERTGSGRRLMPVRVIEVKCAKRSRKPGTRCGQQIDGYYERFGVPVDLVGGMKEAKAYLATIRDIQPLSGDDEAEAMEQLSHRVHATA